MKTTKTTVILLLTSLLMTGCNTDKINRLENEKINLQKNIDSLTLLTADMTVTSHKILGKWVTDKRWLGLNLDIEFTTQGKVYFHFNGKTWNSIYDDKIVMDCQIDGDKTIVYTNGKLREVQDLIFEFKGDTLRTSVNDGYSQTVYKFTKSAKIDSKIK